MPTINKLHLAITIILALGFMVGAWGMHGLFSTNRILMESLLTTQKATIGLSQSQYEQGVILNAMAEDYPPKKLLGEREWCADYSCVISEE